MPLALPAELPASTLLAQLQRQGSYADCFTLTLPMAVTQAQFIEAFYTSGLFKAERWLLRLFAGKGSSDEQAAALAHGSGKSFAVWKVTQRTAAEILLTDQTGRTSSWLMAVEDLSSSGSNTQLFFGSAIQPRATPATGGQPTFGRLFHLLLGLHELYSRRLLEAAAARLMQTTAAQLKR